MDLRTPLDRVLGGRTAKSLEQNLGLATVADLVHYYPRRYAERGKLMSFGELREDEHATVFAEVVTCQGIQLPAKPGRKPLHKTDVSLRDEDGAAMKIAIFGKRYADKQLRPGRRAFFSGKVTVWKGKLQLQSPNYVLVDDDAGQVAAEYAGALVPLYPATSGVGSEVIARSVQLALGQLDHVDDPLPAQIREQHHLIGLLEALRLIHRPADQGERARARRRLVWDEALVLQVVLAQRRHLAVQQASTPRPGRPDGLLAAFDAMNVFELTEGQLEIGAQLTADLARPHPMLRLLQGEVGSGKTLVALRAMLAVVDSGGQAVLLAPTEVLAAQHARSLRTLLGNLVAAGQFDAAPVATRLVLLTGSLGATARRQALVEVADGQAGLVVGTHALMSEGVEFADLGLVVVDEQHRFGVEQREALRAKGAAPHVLVMTATPIPRTVAMTVYGDLEVSTLTELPAGRAPITSHVVPLAEQPAWISRVWQRVIEAAGAGKQSYIVCPRVGDAHDRASAADQDHRPAAAVEDMLPRLAADQLSGLRVAGMHGRMPTEAKDEAMRLFVAGSTDVLVATTVIEVGVDVANATLMVVLDAERFGVSQLHQLRGRVGRGAHAGLCLFVTEAEHGSPARRRLEQVAATSDGFALARLDLEQRREGDVLGAVQSGRRNNLRLLELLRDEEVIVAARSEATRIVQTDPSLTDHTGLAQAVEAVLDPGLADYLERS